MDDQYGKRPGEVRRSPQSLALGFLSYLFGIFAKFVLAFAVGTGAAALACWYYGVPLGFALLGGILVLGIALALALSSDGFGP
jgi:hypothetical protein